MAQTSAHSPGASCRSPDSLEEGLHLGILNRLPIAGHIGADKRSLVAREEGQGSRRDWKIGGKFRVEDCTSESADANI
jgi:hypothetical protein